MVAIAAMLKVYFELFSWSESLIDTSKLYAIAAILKIYSSP